MDIPFELVKFFNSEHFNNYPVVEIPQTFEDSRGKIINIADGELGDVAIITSQKSAVRAGHYHEEDWHLCFLLSGRMEYSWKDSSQEKEIQRMSVKQGQLIFTPAQIPHRMIFSERSDMVVVSKKSRISSNYEADTIRLAEKYFE